MGNGWQLVGRERELGEIGRARTEAASGVVLHGPPGVGKSRLARAALDAARREGAHVVWVQATRSAATVPLSPFAAVLPAGERADDLLELLRSTARALSGRAGTRPLVVGIDDAHLLDSTSASLVLHLATERIGFVVVTVRSGEPPPDAISALWRDAGAPRLELLELDEEATGQLVEEIVGGPVEEGVRRWVWDSSAGNALYVAELVRAALTGGALTEVSGLWRLPARPALGASLTELIFARMTGLSDLERRALELLALGEPLQLALMLEIVGEAPLVALEGRELVVIDADDSALRVRLSHPLYGEAIAGSLPFLRGREIRLTLAAAVQAHGDIDAEDSLRVARWLLDAKEAIPSATLLVAAREANLRGDPSLGAELAQQALQAGAGVPAALLLARAHALQKSFAEAEAVLASIEGAIDTEDSAVDYLQQRAFVLLWGLGRPAEARALIAGAQDWWPDAAWSRRLEQLRTAMSAAMPDDAARNVAVIGEMLQDEALEDSARRELELAHAGSLFFSGRAIEAHKLVWRLRPSVPLRDPIEEILRSAQSGISYESGLDLETHAREMRRALQDGVRDGDRATAGIGAMGLGVLAFLSGRYVDAARYLAESEVQFEQRDPTGALPTVRAFGVGVAHATGDLQRVRSALEACRRASAGPEPPPFLLPYLVASEAWALDAEGDKVAGQKLLLDAAYVNPYPIFRARLAYEAMRLSSSARVAGPVVIEAQGQTDAPLVAAYAGHAAARLAGDGRALMDASAEFERIGTQRYALSAAIDAARLFAAAGRQDSARQAVARARDLIPRGQGGVLPAIEGIDPGAVELTPREAQIIGLAARGMSNANIAEQLVLSVRTVESHLYRAMQKLGLNDRRELRP
jgi:ATP/maltotriose-dependent transcriptional regulator MalT